MNLVRGGSMIISIYRKVKDVDAPEVEVLEDIVKYSIVANRLHYLPLGEHWQEIDLTSYDIMSVVIRKETE